MTQGYRIEKLRRDYPVDDCTCDRDELDRFLIRFTFGNQQANAAQTYVGIHDNEIVGFYSLIVGEVAYDDAPERLTKGLARHPVPIMLLARLAVSTACRLTIRDWDRDCTATQAPTTRAAAVSAGHSGICHRVTTKNSRSPTPATI